MNQQIINENGLWNFIFMWCIKCWDYRQFNFTKPVDLEVAQTVSVICQECRLVQKMNTNDILAYYSGVFHQGSVEK